MCSVSAATSPRLASVLALDIGGTKLAAGIGSSGGHMQRLAGAPTRAGDGAGEVLERALALAADVLAAETAAGGHIEAIGVSTMGLSGPDGVQMAPNVPGWEALAIGEAVARAFPTLTRVIDNDVKLATRAEMVWGGLRGVSEGIYLNLGSGIAAGIVTGGRLLTGAHGAAGEIGYTLAHGEPESRMAADGATPFEDRYGGAGMARRLADSGLGDSVADLVARRAQDPAAAAEVDRVWTAIAVQAANLCIALDPAVLVLGGGYLRSDSGLTARVREVVDRAVPFPPTVSDSRFGADASLRGAAVAALEGAGAQL